MTAQRWWVKVGARWLARINGVNQQLQLGFLAMTGTGIALEQLRAYGYGGYAREFLVLIVIAVLGYAYLYNEGGVRNQVMRDNHDLQSNWAGPNMRIDDELIGIAVFAALNNRKPTEQEREIIADSVHDGFMDLRDGVDLNDNNDSERVAPKQS